MKGLTGKVHTPLSHSKEGALGSIHKTYTPTVTIKEHPSPAQRSLSVQRRGGGGGPELVTVILLHTHKEKVVPVDSSMPCPSLPRNPHRRPQPSPKSCPRASPSTVCRRRSSGLPKQQDTSVFHHQKTMGTVVFILQTSASRTA